MLRQNSNALQVKFKLLRKSCWADTKAANLSARIFKYIFYFKMNLNTQIKTNIYLHLKYGY